MKTPPVFQLGETELRPGTSLVEASAGTGKTFTIAGLFLRLIIEKNLSVREILVVTYTVAATEELRHRIRDTLARALQAFSTGTTDDPFLRALLMKHAGQARDLAARLDRALYGFDEAPIYTIHGFCQRVLRDRAFETGNLFDTELVTDQTTLLRQLVEDYWRKQFYGAGRIPVIFALKNGLSPDGLLPLLWSSLPHPFLKILSPVDGQTPESLAAALEFLFNSLREVWREERDSIRGHFGKQAKWANSPYNKDDAMADAFRQVESCLGAPEFAPTALDILRLFRTSVLAESVSKRAKLPPPEHRFFDLCEELGRAEDHYVIGVKLAALRYVQQELPRRKDQIKVQFFDDLLTRLHRALVGGAPTAGQFPLTPALSPGERESLAAELDDQLAAEISPARREVLPLPKGEGRGEGEQSAEVQQAGTASGGGSALAALLRRQYRAALIDEFQDTDPLQYDIFQRVFGNVGQASRLPQGLAAVDGAAGETPALPYLFLIGDPKQAIYGFRGADIFTYLRASRKAGHTYTLGQNWRSEAGLVRAVNAVFSASAQPFVFPGIQFHPVEAKGEADKQALRVDGGAPPPLEIWFWRRTGKEITKTAAAELLPSVVAAEIVEPIEW